MNGYCKHGTYVGGIGADYMCGYCEDGTEPEPPEILATVHGSRSTDEVAAYLPSNYKVIGSAVVEGRLVVGISGQDVAGWKFADYVAPRLASGCMTAVQVTS